MATAIKLSDISLDSDLLQPRAMINHSVVDEYAEAMRGGEEFPPIIIFDDGEHKWLADGYHRYYAARKAEINEISAEFRNGTKVDALRFALSANTRHGLRRSQIDRRRAILIAIQQFGDLSNREIARSVNVDDKTVAKYRQRLAIVEEVKSQIATAEIGDGFVGWTKKGLLFIAKLPGPYVKIGFIKHKYSSGPEIENYIDITRRGVHTDSLELATCLYTHGLGLTDFEVWEKAPKASKILEGDGEAV
jgi:hypothetical protein